MGTAALLRQWQRPITEVLAGLCHSLYGTEAFKPKLLDLEQRNKLEEVVGVRVERLVYLFGVMDRRSFWQGLDTSCRHSLKAFNTFHNHRLLDGEWESLLHLMLANAIDQKHGGEIRDHIYASEFLRCKNELTPSAWRAFLKYYDVRARVLPEER